MTLPFKITQLSSYHSRYTTQLPIFTNTILYDINWQQNLFRKYGTSFNHFLGKQRATCLEFKGDGCLERRRIDNFEWFHFMLMCCLGYVGIRLNFFISRRSSPYFWCGVVWQYFYRRNFLLAQSLTLLGNLGSTNHRKCWC